MPRIIITMAVGVGSAGSGPTPVLDELVDTDRLNDDRASLRLLERICWAIEDAEQQEREDTERKEHHAANDGQCTIVPPSASHELSEQGLSFT